MKTKILTLAAAIGLAITQASNAATQTWNGGGGNNSWTTGLNWTSGNATVAGDSLIFAGSTQLSNNNNLTANSTITGITFSPAAGAFSLAGNAINLNGNITDSEATNIQTIALGLNLQSNSTISVVGGGKVVLSGALTSAIASNNAITTTGAGTLNISGTWSNTNLGINVGGGSTLDFTGATSITGRALSIGNGTVSVKAGNVLNFANQNASFGVNNVAETSNYNQTGGSITFNQLTTSNGIGTNTVMNISGGNLTATTLRFGSRGNTTSKLGSDMTISGAATLVNITTFQFGDNSSGFSGCNNTITINSGTMNATGTFDWGTNGADTRNNTVELAGGTLATVATKVTGATANATLNIGNGSTLKVLGAGTGNLTNFLNGADTVNIKDGGAVIDTQANNITIANPLLNFSGATTASLTKNGTGALSLSGANTYTGGTTVNNGVLSYVNTAAQPATGATTVGAAGTLALGVITGAGNATLFGTNDIDTLFSTGVLGNITLNSSSGVGIDTSAGNVTWSTDQSAARGFAKLGLNTLTVSGNNSYTGATTVYAGVLTAANANALGSTAGATTVVSGASVQIGGGVTISENITLSGPGEGGANGALRTDSASGGTWAGQITLGDANVRIGALAGQTLTVTGSIVGAQPATFNGQSGTGVVILNPTTSNSFTGATNIIRGILQLGKTNALPTGTTLTLGASSVSDAAQFNLAGFDQTLVGLAKFANTTDATVTNTGGTLSTLTLDSASATAAQTFGGNITAGAGNIKLVKSGLYTQTLNGPGNTFTGGVEVKQGGLTLNFAGGNLTAPTTNILATANALTLGGAGGGTLTLTGKANSVNSQAFAGTTLNPGANQATLTATTNNTVSLDLGALTRNAGATLNITQPAGTISATNGVITSAANTNGILGGWATVANADWAVTNGASGITAFAGYTALPTSGAVSTSNYNATVATSLVASQQANSLKYAPAAATDALDLGANDLTLTSGGLLSTGSVSGNITGSGKIIAANNELFIHQNNSAGLTVFAQIADNGGNPVKLIKAGGQTLILAGNNTFTGGTDLNIGRLNLNTSSALGTGALTIQGTATQVNLASGVSIGNNITVSNTSGTSFVGLLYGPSTGNATLSGTITINGSPNGGGLFGAAGGTLLVTGPINSSVPITVRNGTVVFSGGGNYSSFANNGGVVKLGADNGLFTGAVLDTALSNPGGAPVVDLNGFNQEVAGLIQTAASANFLVNNVAGVKTLTINTTGSNSYTYGSVIGGGANLAITKTGTGTQTFTGTNTYSGDTIVSGGTLVVGSALALQNSPLNYDNQGGAVSFGNLTAATVGGLKGSQSLPSTSLATLTLNPVSGAYVTYSGNLTDSAGAPAITKSGAGTQSLTGTNTYSGNTTITGGALSIGTTEALPGWNVNGRYSVGANAALAVSNLVVDGDVATMLATTNFLANAAIGFDTSAGNRTYSVGLANTAQGALGLTKTGANTLTVEGTNSYTGPVAVLGGTLKAGSATALPNNTSALTLTGDGTLDLNGNDAAFTGITAAFSTTSITDSSASPGVTTLTLNNTATIASSIVKGPSRDVALRVQNTNGAFQLTNGNNTFSGGIVLLNNLNGTRMSPGTVTPGAYGTGAITVGELNTDKAQIYFSTANQTFTNDIVANTALGTDRVGTLRVDPIGITLTGNLTANNADFTFYTNATASVNATGKITGPSGLKLLSNGAGGTALTVTLSNVAGTNDYGGNTTINENPQSGRSYTLALGANNQIPNGSGKGDVVINRNGTGLGTFRMEGFSDTINGLSGNGTVTTTVAGASVLTLGDNNATASFSGNITNTTGTVGIVKIGAGSQTLAGPNSYTGSTTVSAGTLIVSGGGTINTTSDITVATGATLTNDTATALTPALALGEGSTLSGSGNFNPTAMTLTANLADGFTPIAAGTALTKAGALTFTLSAVTDGTYSLFTGTPAASFTSVNVGGTPLTFDGGDSLWKGNVGGFDYAFSDSLNTLTVIPEPKTWALIGLGLGFTLFRFSARSRRLKRLSGRS